MVKRRSILIIIILGLTLAISHLTFAKNAGCPITEVGCDEEAQTQVFFPVISTSCHQGVTGRGAGIAFRSSTTPEMLADLGVSWGYSWNLHEDWQTVFPCIENIPMNWCASEPFWDKWVSRVPEDYEGPILFINEWQHHEQCNAPLEVMVEIYGRMVARHSAEQIVFGNFADSEYRPPYEWGRFDDLYYGIIGANLPFKPLAIGLHDYRCHTGNTQPSEQINSLLAHLGELGIDRPDLELWITEYGCTSDHWLNIYTRYYEQHPKITRWAHFGVCMPPSYFIGTTLFEVVETGPVVCNGISQQGKIFSGIID